VTPLLPVHYRPKSVPDSEGHSRPLVWLRVLDLVWHECQPTSRQLCQHVCWQTGRQVRCPHHHCATDSLPAFSNRRTRWRTPPGSSNESPTAARRKERGLDPSACASAITSPTIAGMSHRVRPTNQVHDRGQQHNHIRRNNSCAEYIYSERCSHRKFRMLAAFHLASKAAADAGFRGSSNDQQLLIAHSRFLEFLCVTNMTLPFPTMPQPVQ